MNALNVPGLVLSSYICYLLFSQLLNKVDICMFFVLQIRKWRLKQILEQNDGGGFPTRSYLIQSFVFSVMISDKWSIAICTSCDLAAITSPTLFFISFLIYALVVLVIIIVPEISQAMLALLKAVPFPSSPVRSFSFVFVFVF